MGKGLFGLLKREAYKNKNSLPKAIAFVDYEHWFISMEKIHHAKPNIQAWFNDLKKKCNIVEVIFFADFSKFREKEVETKRIRTFTNKIIDTYNPDAYHKKDYTDFIILDNIYQKVFTNQDIDLFIVFSGDGHFSSAIAFLRNFCNKQVGVYGVKNCISKNLINNADWVEEIPLISEGNQKIYNLILSSLRIAMDKGVKQPTFLKLVENVSSKYYVQYNEVKNCLIELIEQGYIVQTTEKTKQHETIRVIRPDWKKIKNDSLWIDS